MIIVDKNKLNELEKLGFFKTIDKEGNDQYILFNMKNDEYDDLKNFSAMIVVIKRNYLKNNEIECFAQILDLSHRTLSYFKKMIEEKIIINIK